MSGRIRDWWWCLHCERAFSTDVRERSLLQDSMDIPWCRTPGCTGAPFVDVCSWEHFRAGIDTERGTCGWGNVEAPEVPEEGEYYPVHGIYERGKLVSGGE